MKHLKRFAASTLAITVALCSNIVCMSADNTVIDGTELTTAYHSLLKNDDLTNGILPINNDTEVISLDHEMLTVNAIDSVEEYTDQIKAISETEVAAENSAPVAGLTYMIANPESLLNGKITTETIIYWLWNDGTTAYTYDPDGDEITGYFIDGIYDYITGNLTIGGEVVGFVTSIPVAAEYELFFYVSDEKGAYSNVVYYTFSVEPADGNQRPICSTTVSDTSPSQEQYVLFDWTASSDPDDDQINGVRVRVYDPSGNYEYVTASSKYYVAMADYKLALKFSEVGSYQVWIALRDAKNAWSDWDIIPINVIDACEIENLKLEADDHNNTSSIGFTWANYEQSIKYVNEGANNPETVLDAVSQFEVPSEFRGKTILGTNWSVSGYIKSLSGEPLPNAKVSIIVPMIGRNFTTDVTTDSDGYFTYTCNADRWYRGWGQIYDLHSLSGLTSTKWCRYGNYNTTTWMYDTTLYVKCDEAKQLQSFSVIASAGSTQYKVVGNKWIYIKPMFSDSGYWEEI